MQVKSMVMAVVLATGLLAGCGGVEGGLEDSSPAAVEAATSHPNICIAKCNIRFDHCVDTGGDVSVCFQRFDECVTSCPTAEADAPAPR
ncbi:hypothetical protein [Myxococcus sp. SDU36]|uniref:hypothetical protein n=1 Tax=Myxococcus sp. SDU36 TaxID=2831967 RepID=UPI0025435B3E|nr:hypothetical protein [Myxococcus sp. SDU36]WIG97515.1 hypothetical protein KGD87_09095 [Myxococcus sp. SDU36]